MSDAVNSSSAGIAAQAESRLSEGQRHGSLDLLAWHAHRRHRGHFDARLP